MKNTPLSPEAIRRGVERLRDELGRADRDRIDLLLPLFKKESRVSLASVFEKLFPGQLREAALTSFRQLRKRLNDAATSEGISLALETDSQKKSEPEQRWCWFTGEDSAAEAVAQLIEEETAFLEHTEQDAYEVRDGKPVIRYFISYSHKDDKFKNDLCQRLEDLFKIATNYYFEPWHDGMILPGDNWRDQIQKAIENCNFGLLLVSPVFLGGDFITQNELPAFVPQNLAQPEAGKRAIPVALKPLRFDGTVDLKGLQELQIFRDSEGKAYSQRTGTKKDEFADALFEQILRVVELRMVAPVKAEYQRHSQIEHHMRREIETQMAGCNFVDGDGYPSSLDKLDPKSATDKAPAQRINALTHLYAWAKDPSSPPYFALLGELGMGKTTTCLAFARELLAQRLQDPSLPLPIYLDLRHLGEISRTEPGLEEILHTVLQKNWRGGRKIDLRADEIISLVQEQGGLAIFDGLDEVLVHLSPAGGQRFVRELLRILPPMKTQKGSNKAARKGGHGRLLLSCRTHYFRTLREQKNLLLGEGREPMGANDYRALVLLPFSHEQIITYLKQTLPDQDPQRVMETIKSVHNLTEMAERPYTLSLITQQINQIERWRMEGRTVTGVTLYRHLVQSWLERDTGKHQITSTHKQRIMEYFAAELWRSGRRTWCIEDVEQWLIDLLRNHPEIAAHYEGKDRELLKEDLRTATFLVREGEDQFRFAHTSLLEFFLACHLQRALLDGAVDRWVIPLASRESLDFLGQLLMEDETGREKALAAMLKMLRDGYQPLASEQALAYALLAFGKGYPAPILTGIHMEGADLRGWKLHGKPDKVINILDGIWRGAQLDGASFQYTNMSGSDFSKSNLLQAEFLNCKMHQILIEDANLAGTLFRSCDQTKADMTGSHFHRTTWLRCTLNDIKGIPDSSPEGFYVLSSQPPNEMPENRMLEVFAGHSGCVMNCTYSPDGRHLATTGSDSTVQIWDVESGQCLNVLHGHTTDTVINCTYSLDGHLLATAGGDDSTIRVWNSDNGDCIAILSGYEDEVWDCTFSPDGKNLASAGFDGTIRIWDVKKGKCLKIIKAHSEKTYSCTYSPDGRFLAAAGRGDVPVSVWDVEVGSCIFSPEYTEEAANHCQISPDGKWLAVSWGHIFVWEIKSGKLIAKLICDDGVGSCNFSPDGQYLAGGSMEGKLYFWDTRSWELTSTITEPEGRFSDGSFSLDWRYVAIPTGNYEIRIRDLREGGHLLSLKNYDRTASACNYSNNGRILISGGWDGFVKVWDVATGHYINSFKSHIRGLESCSISPDNKMLVTVGFDEMVSIWDLKSDRRLRTIYVPKVSHCSYSPNGQYVAMTIKNSVEIFTINELYELNAFEGKGILVGANFFDFSPDSQSVATLTAKNTITVRNIETRKKLITLEVNENIWRCSYSPDGRRLATAGFDGDIQIWDVGSGNCLKVLKGHKNGVNVCLYSPDGNVLVSAGNDSTIHIWNANNGQLKCVLKGHYGAITGCTILPDSRYVTSSSYDGTVRVWDLEIMKEIRRTYLLPDNNWAVIDPINNHIIQVSGDAWRWLGWQGRDSRTGRMERWPAEIFGPLPEWTPPDVK